ncbi:MAG TPA: hypothetical protein DGB85_02695 [Deltaproteobacteria bacterium]|nr:hypothetical protein [Deltaproteobacteria bacterium]
MTIFQKRIFCLGLLLSVGTAFAQEESVDDLLEGFEESPSVHEESVDDLLGDFEEPEASTNELLGGFEEPVETPDIVDDLLDGFEESSSIVTESDRLSLPTGLAGSTGINIAYAYAQSDPNPDKPDYRGLRKLRLYLQLEYQYDLTSSLRFFVDGKAFRDLAYQFLDREEYSEEYLKAYEQETELRETFLSTSLGPNIDVKFGRQIKVWGKADLLSVVDVLNPTDNREPGLIDIDDSRLPVTMTQIDYYTGAWNLNLVLIHEIRFGKSPEFGSEFYFADVESFPEEIPTETEYGAALNGHFTGWDLSFYAASVYNDQGRADGGFQPSLGVFPDRVIHDRLQLLGTAFSTVTGSWIVRGEIADVQGLRFTNFSKTFSRQDHVFGIEYSGISDGALSFELAWEWIREFETTLEEAPNEQEQSTVTTAIRFQQDFLNQTLSFNVIAFQFGEFGSSGSSQRIGLDYDWADGLNVGGGILLYHEGDTSYSKRIANNDRLFAGLKYSF